MTTAIIIVCVAIIAFMLCGIGFAIDRVAKALEDISKNMY